MICSCKVNSEAYFSYDLKYAEDDDVLWNNPTINGVLP